MFDHLSLAPRRYHLLFLLASFTPSALIEESLRVALEEYKKRRGAEEEGESE